MSGVQQYLFKHSVFGSIANLCWAFVLITLMNTKRALAEPFGYEGCLPSIFTLTDDHLGDFELGDMLPTGSMEILLRKSFKEVTVPTGGLRLPKTNEALVVCTNDHYTCFFQNGTQDKPDLYEFNSLTDFCLVKSTRERYREVTDGVRVWACFCTPK
jgi:hypothetical protein